MDEYKFYSYVDDKSILVITPNNKLVRIKCPFAVMDLKGRLLQVDSIAEKDNTIFYRINGKYTCFSGFHIVASP